MSASGSSLSKVEFLPSLSEVTTNVWPASSRNLRKPQLTENAAQQLAWLEVNGTRRGAGLAIGIFRDLLDVVAGIGLWIAVDRIGVEYK